MKSTELKSRFLVLAALLLSLGGGGLAGCSDYHLVSLRPAFTISWAIEQGFVPQSLPSSKLAFGIVSTGAVQGIEVRLENPGRSKLDICDIYLAHIVLDEDGVLLTELRLDTDPELSTEGVGSPMVIPDRTALDIEVVFSSLYGTKIDSGRYLVVKHELNTRCATGTGNPLYIPIDGEGFGDPVPDIYATPQIIDFSVVGLEEPSDPVELTVGNAGPGLLEVGSVTLAGSDADQFVLLPGSVADTTFATAEAGFIQVVFAPDHQGQFEAEIVIESNDPNENPLSIVLGGVANPDVIGDGPVAICAADILTTTQTYPVLDGSASFESDGLPLTYSWVLTPPLGSAAFLYTPNDPTTATFLDLAGTYTGELTVTNPNDQSDSCTQNIEAVPYEDFRVELFWSVPDDLDLHLLSPQGGANSAHNAPWDCHYANMNPSWGVTANPLDDPSLDLDDISGLGPENINIFEPATGAYSGSYEVFVHDYPGTVDYYPANNATVRIYLNGTIAKTYQFAMTGEDTDYYVASIAWPSGQITDCNGLAGCP